MSSVNASRFGGIVVALVGISLSAACTARASERPKSPRPEKLIEQAAEKMATAELPTTGPATRSQLIDQARELYLAAEKGLTAEENRLLARSTKLWVNGVDLEWADLTREEIKDKLYWILVIRLLLKYEIARTYRPRSEESTATLTTVIEEFAILRKYAKTHLARRYALLWEGRCHAELGQFNEALWAFTEVATLEDGLPEIEALKHKAMIAHLATCMMPQFNRHAKAAKDARIWVDWTPEAQRATAGGLGIQYLGAEAMLRCVEEDARTEAEKAEMFGLAQRYLLNVANHPGEYREKATSRLADEDFAEHLRRWPQQQIDDADAQPNEPEPAHTEERTAKEVARPLILTESETAIRSCPEVEESLGKRRGLWGTGFDSKRAMAEAEAAIRDNPDSAEAYHQRANAKLRTRDYRGALDDVNMAIKLDPSRADGFFLRGLVNGRLQRHEDAKADFDRVLQLDPRDGDVLALRGDTNFLLGNLDAAIEDCYIATRVNPGGWYTRRTLAKAYLAKGELDHALFCVNLMIRLFPEDPEAHQLRESILARQEEGDGQPPETGRAEKQPNEAAGG